MLKIKNSIIGLLIALSVTSCGEFSKVLNRGTSAEQYILATDLYESGKYNKALQLFEKVIPAYRGKPQMERIQFMVSMANYKTKNYLLAAYHFDRFTKNYPKSTKKEEASYLAAHSYYLAIPRSSLDQSDTKKAIDAFQRFIDTYPTSNRIAAANKFVKEMQLRLEKKAYDIAYQYYHTENYKSALVAFDNFLSDNLGTSFKEDALFYKSKAAHDLALKSVVSKKEARIKSALQAIDRLERNFKDTKYKKEAEKLRDDLENELNLMASTKNE
jgi:outer membrane protein assembly factor BamD